MGTRRSSNFGNAWKCAVSLLILMVAKMLLGWPLVSYDSRANQVGSENRVPRRNLSTVASAVNFANLLKKADSLSCAKRLNISFSHMFSDVKLNRRKLCGSSNTICPCTNPTIPVDKLGERRSVWYNGFKRNQYMAASARQSLDVVFLGDSIFEHWITGTELTLPRDYCHGMPELWKSLFAGHALALALSGDRCNNLLFRLLNGEMPDTLQAKAWWILIGTNDVADRCSKQSILVGNLAVLEEVMRRKPNSRFILQGLLPRGRKRLDKNRMWKQFRWINERLACLTLASSQLEFYNGSSLFLTKGGYYVNRTRMYDSFHPTLEGYKIMAKDMIQRLRQWGIWS
jgi:lysophospholipase L1-like esterase